MNRAEEGVLLLCSSLGQENSKPLTMAQFRDLGMRVRASGIQGDASRELNRSDLCGIGYSEAQADSILRLLDRQSILEQYLSRAESMGIYPITRLSDQYPIRIAARKKLSSPPVLFCMGDVELLKQPSAAVVGSRVLKDGNAAFARNAGVRIAKENLTLVSGGAAGADLAAQEACLSNGGHAVIFLPDRLSARKPVDRVLYCVEDGYDLPFSSQRALRRNALIHMQGDLVLAAQCTYGSGGTWHGCLENLRQGWTPVFVFDDGSDGARALIERGATGVRELVRIRDLQPSQLSIFDERSKV